MEAFSLRASNTDFSDRKLSLQDLSDLLFAANGVNRKDIKKRTAPSAMNAQDIDVYVFLQEGVYLYDAFQGVLNPVVPETSDSGSGSTGKRGECSCYFINGFRHFKVQTVRSNETRKCSKRCRHCFPEHKYILCRNRTYNQNPGVNGSGKIKKRT